MLLAEAFDPRSFQVLLAVAGVTTLLLARGAMARRKPALEPRTPLVLQHRTTGERSPSTQDVQRTLVEMHEFARDVQAQLDNKLAMLQQLIRTADERIARLEALEASLADEPSSASGE